MSRMFFQCKSLIYLPDLSKWDTSNVTEMDGKLECCDSLISIPGLSQWNTCKVTDMHPFFF